VTDLIATCTGLRAPPVDLRVHAKLRLNHGTVYQLARQSRLWGRMLSMEARYPRRGPAIPPSRGDALGETRSSRARGRPPTPSNH
jgi:hypothetical protein